MQTAILVFPGSNREQDMARAINLVTGKPAHLVWHAEHELPKGTDLVILPGGFSYGDYLRCGAIAARAPVMDATRAFASKGGHVLGVCNGFQILCESGLLEGVLMRNRDRRFVSKAVDLVVERTNSAFTNAYSQGETLNFPVAHGEGNFVADEATIQRIEGEGQVLFRYVDDFNGSTNRIVGLTNAKGNVAGLMPHPENHVDPSVGRVDGVGLFKSMMAKI
jgi:phosphoribosylformylglycinamidine synthase subunit PurQ / glutaminase